MKTMFFLVIILSLTTIIAENPLSIEIFEGESNFTIEEYFPSIYASQLIEKYPSIQSISTEEYGQTFGYINLFGGVGTNFQIDPAKTYKIFTSENITVVLK